MKHVDKHSKVCINDDPGLTLTHLMARPKLLACAFKWGKLLESRLMRKSRRK